MLFIEQINTHHNHYDDYFLFKESAVLKKNVHMSKLLLYINFHTRPNDMSTMKAMESLLILLETFFFSFFEAGSFHLADIS